MELNAGNKAADSFYTHEVFNQPLPLANYNLFDTNLVLKECVERLNLHSIEKLRAFGTLLGLQQSIDWGFQANQHPPQLKAFSRYGHRINEVEFHPSWHSLLDLAVTNRLHNLPWAEAIDYGHSQRAALMMMSSEIEFGHLCPISMTYSIFPVLKKHASTLLNNWSDKLLSTEYDSRFLPFNQKRGVLCGMAMTEKQGGSDVRANTSFATYYQNGDAGEEYLLTGHKWFCSAPMIDAFLVLAQTEKGLSCFFMPRYQPDGTLNNFFIQRLKDKLGNRSNASGEIEFLDAWAVLVGEEEKGVSTIIEMVNHTRLDCTIGSTGLLHQALVQAIHHCLHRSAFGKRLIDQALMQNVLADMCLETEAAIQLTMRLARSFDEANSNEDEELFKRVVTPIAKFWICKRTPPMIYEALECLGGAGFIEESILPRLYREAPLNSVWEGSGNVICLDVKRAIQNQPVVLESLLKEIEKAKGGNTALDKFVEEFKTKSASLLNEADCRISVERAALLLQASLLVRYSPSFVAEAFIDSRLINNHQLVGTLSNSIDFVSIIKRMWPLI